MAWDVMCCKDILESYIHMGFATHVFFFSVTVKKIQSIKQFSRGLVIFSSLKYR